MQFELNVPYIEKVYVSLKNAIIQNELKQGEILNERNLADDLRVSRTPLRDALNLLEKEGWLIRQGKNRAVSTLRWEDIREIYEVRVPNESLAVRRAAEHAKPEDIPKLRRLLDDMEAQYREDRDYIQFLENDKRWHSAVSRLSGNERLCRILENLHEQFVRISFVTIKKGGDRLAGSMREHREILAAIASGDPDLAAKASETHITAWYRSLRENWEGEIHV